MRKLRKTTLPTLLLLTFTIMAGVTNIYQIHVPKAKAASPTVKVTSAYNITEPGMTFNVNITVTDVTKLFFWIIDLKWNASAISLTTGDTEGIRKLDLDLGRYVYYNIYEGPFIENAREDQDAMFLANSVNQSKGEIYHLSGGYTEIGPAPSGSGVIAYINFTCLEVTETNLEIFDSILKDNATRIMDYETVNGIVTYKLPPVPPIWTQLWFQATMIVIVVIVIAAVAVYVVKKRPAKPAAAAKAEEVSYEDIL